MNKLDLERREIRVLVVENFRPLRETYVDLLEYLGYTPIVARGEGMALVNDARRKAQENRCHLAIVDIRLDISLSGREIGARGLDLVRQISPTESIVITAYQEFPLVQRAYEEENVRHIVPKDADSPEKLRVALAKVREEKWPSTPISPATSLAEAAARLSREHHPVTAAEVHDLIMRVFAKESAVELSPVAQKWQTPQSLATVRGRSVVYRATPAGKNPCVIKLALRERAEREEQNYRHYIEQRLGGDAYLRLEQTDALWNVGASVYRTHGHDGAPVTFSQYFADRGTDDIIQPLRSFFLGVWQGHYSEANPRAADALFECYDAHWSGGKVGSGVLRRAAHDRADYAPPARVRELTDCAINPFVWVGTLADPAVLEQVLGKDRREIQTCVVHGDLHGDNLLVDSGNNVWPIDYERTGASHVLTDFVELEHDIITRMATVNDLEHYCAFVASVLGCQRGGIGAARELAVGVTEDENLVKAGRVIDEIRYMAQELKLHYSWREYCLGLLFNAIFVMQKLMEDDKQKSQHFLRVHVLASLLCRQLALDAAPDFAV